MCLPDDDLALAIAGAHPSIPSDDAVPVFDRGRVDHPIDRIARKRLGELGGAGGDDGRQRGGTDQLREAIEPRPKRDPRDDASSPVQPGQLIPGERRDDDLVSVVDNLGLAGTEASWLGGVPME